MFAILERLAVQVIVSIKPSMPDNGIVDEIVI
jgi:hypothetical protein